MEYLERVRIGGNDGTREWVEEKGEGKWDSISKINKFKIRHHLIKACSNTEHQCGGLY
jgi:hypothetical protein